MVDVYAPPISYVLGAALVSGAAWASLRSARLIADGLRRARPLAVVLGIRAAVLSLVATLFAVAVLSAEPGFIVLGALVLGEELYETGLLALIIRRAERRTGGDPGC
jgi:hypothetical protein